MRSLIYVGRRHLSALSPTIRELLSNPPKEGTLLSAHGHVKSTRHSKRADFLDLSDGTSHDHLAVVIKKSNEALPMLQCSVGECITVKGTWVKSRGTQDYELVVNADDESHKMGYNGRVPETYPIQKKNTTMQNLRQLPTLRHRTSTLASILRLRSFLESKLMEFFNDHQFIKVSPPIITASDCEGAGEQFRIESVAKLNDSQKEPEDYFFGKTAFLTVSTQLHVEVLTLSLNRAWTLTPCFRAEVSNTNRHLSEFWMLEAEMCYVTEIEQLTKFTEEMIRYVTQAVKDSNDDSPGNGTDLIESRFDKDEKRSLEERWDSLLTEKEWPSITYTEAIEIINREMNKGRSEGRLNWGDSIQTPHEKWLAGKYFKSPVFITDYPKAEKPFYMLPSKSYADDKPTVACFDLILPEIGELIGGSLREHNYDKLLQEIGEKGMNKEDIEWYLSTRQNGSAPHGGFGMGFERLVAYLSNMENVKDVIAFPRVPQSCSC